MYIEYIKNVYRIYRIYVYIVYMYTEYTFYLGLIWNINICLQEAITKTKGFHHPTSFSFKICVTLTTLPLKHLLKNTFYQEVLFQL